MELLQTREKKQTQKENQETSKMQEQWHLLRVCDGRSICIFGT